MNLDAEIVTRIILNILAGMELYHIAEGIHDWFK